MPLFPYQIEGARWLAARKSAILADEMGLGKSAQAITALDTVGVSTATIVCPASLCENWRREIEMWSMGLFDYRILSYDKAARDGLPAAEAIVFDECHYLKSHAAKRTKVLLGSSSPANKAKYVWALSGTPAPNNVGELHPWLSFFGADVLGYPAFIKRYTNYTMTEYGPKIFSNKRETMPDLKAKLEPFMLRRRKEDVLKELPPVRWGDIRLAGGVGSVDKSLASKVAADIELHDDLPPDEEHLAAMRRVVGQAKAGPLANFLADELCDSDHKIVVFAWHKDVLDALHEGLRPFGVARIDGSTPVAKRQGEVDAFQQDPKTRVFLGNIEAAGTGITLTASAHLVFAEMSWTPGHNAQAAMRVHRIGQRNSVLIRTATLLGSIDEGVNAVLARKTRNLEQLYEEGQAA